MSDYSEYHRRVEAWRKAGATEQLRMIAYYGKVWGQQETNPEAGFNIITQCRNEAQRLNEPWWVLYFEYQRLATLTASMHDFGRALPLAQELMVKFAAPEGRAHSEYDSLYTSVLYTFLSIDPIGYRDELERGFAYLDSRIPREPIQDRFIFDFRRAEYLDDSERREESYDIVMKSFASTDCYPDPANRPWHKAWHLFLICPLCHSLGRMEELAVQSRAMEEYARKFNTLKRVLAAALIWQATTFRVSGDQTESARAFHEGMRYLSNLAIKDEVCADPIAAYYEAGGEWKEVVAVREKELVEVERKGMLHRACRILIDRCRLLSLAGSLTPADVERARQAAAKLRTPEWHLERLEKALRR